jgi:hypothetical protein
LDPPKPMIRAMALWCDQSDDSQPGSWHKAQTALLQVQGTDMPLRRTFCAGDPTRSRHAACSQLCLKCQAPPTARPQVWGLICGRVPALNYPDEAVSTSNMGSLGCPGS